MFQANLWRIIEQSYDGLELGIWVCRGVRGSCGERWVRYESLDALDALDATVDR
jgi:hypothetical protein